VIPIESLTISEATSIREAMNVTSRSLNVGFVVDKEMKLLGILTDGDIRRRLTSGSQADDLIGDEYNSDPVTCNPSGRPNRDIPDTITVLPIVDGSGILIGYKTIGELRKTALITGITGQDGAYLAYYLLKLGYFVVGAHRRSSTDSFERLDRLGIRSQIELVTFDLIDLGSFVHLLERYEPQEVYNLAAQSFVQASFTEPRATLEYTGGGVLNILEAIRLVNPSIKFYQASSSEMYGKVRETPQTEETPFHPRSPYAVAKAYGHWITVNYRESYNLFACSGILFNHESPLRGLEFVTRKISHAVARIRKGLESELALGNLSSQRDWGYAYDYVRCMWLMLQQESPDDYVIATGHCHTVEDFVNRTFEAVDLPVDGHVTLDPRFVRPCEVDILRGDPQKAVRQLGWDPNTTSFDQLVEGMVSADLAMLDGNRVIDPEALCTT